MGKTTIILCKSFLYLTKVRHQITITCSDVLGTHLRLSTYIYSNSMFRLHCWRAQMLAFKENSSDRHSNGTPLATSGCLHTGIRINIENLALSHSSKFLIVIQNWHPYGVFPHSSPTVIHMVRRPCIRSWKTLQQQTVKTKRFHISKNKINW